MLKNLVCESPTLEFKSSNLNKLLYLNNPKMKINHPLQWLEGRCPDKVSISWTENLWMWGTLVVVISLSLTLGIQEDILEPETARTRTHQTREFSHWVKTHLAFRNTDCNKINHNIYHNRNNFTSFELLNNLSLNAFWIYYFSKYRLHQVKVPLKSRMNLEPHPHPTCCNLIKYEWICLNVVCLCSYKILSLICLEESQRRYRKPHGAENRESD